MENLKSIKEYTPEELEEYYEEKTALDRMEEQKLEEDEDEEVDYGEGDIGKFFNFITTL